MSIVDPASVSLLSFLANEEWCEADPDYDSAQEEEDEEEDDEDEDSEDWVRPNTILLLFVRRREGEQKLLITAVLRAG